MGASPRYGEVSGEAGTSSSSGLSSGTILKAGRGKKPGPAPLFDISDDPAGLGAGLALALGDCAAPGDSDAEGNCEELGDAVAAGNGAPATGARTADAAGVETGDAAEAPNAALGDASDAGEVVSEEDPEGDSEDVSGAPLCCSVIDAGAAGCARSVLEVESSDAGITSASGNCAPGPCDSSFRSVETAPAGFCAARFARLLMYAIAVTFSAPSPGFACAWSGTTASAPILHAK